jgi:hypothetical protein
MTASFFMLALSRRLFAVSSTIFRKILEPRPFLPPLDKLCRTIGEGQTGGREAPAWTIPNEACILVQEAHVDRHHNIRSLLSEK